MPTVAFHTLGCKVNHYESEAMIDLFKKNGYNIVDFSYKADVYIVNSCTVTNEAARKSRQMARRAKRKNPEAIVALIGCYTQVSPDEVREIEGVDLFVGSSNRSKIVDFVESIRDGGKVEIDVLEYQDLNDFEEMKIESLNETTRAYVKIEEGCNQFCSYCIIPYARGPVRSRKVHSILDEVSRLVNRGVKEIVLTGTHLGAFGSEQGESNMLEKLISKLISIPELAHIRLSSIEVTEVSDELLELIATEDKVCPHLHLPLQSGSNYILQKMKRPYTTGEFRQIIKRIRDKIHDIAITTDIIVGFPGENKKRFRESFDFVKEMKFSRLHVFPFSPREGTPAARIKEQISGNIKKEYSKKMRKLNEELMLSYQKRFIGKTRQLVVEDNRDYRTDFLTGMTDNYIRVLIDGDNKYMGQLVTVKLKNSYNFENAIGYVFK